jgi:hypothetical protein
MKKCKNCGSDLVTFSRQRTDNKGLLIKRLELKCVECEERARGRHRKKIREGDVNSLAGYLLTNIKHRAKKKELDYTWTKLEIIDVLNEGKCQATGYPFILRRDGRYGRSPFRPSADRIDPKKGYTKENTQWVIYMWNCMKNEFNPEDVASFLTYVKKSKDVRLFLNKIESMEDEQTTKEVEHPPEQHVVLD